MSKQKHLNALIATITVALEYDTADIAQLTTLNAQVREAARKLPGYRAIDIRLGKVPAPPVEPAPVVVETLPQQQDTGLELPPFLKRAP